MRYLHGKTKVNKGGSITVTISKPTRVLILNEREFKRYKNNHTFTYYGGPKDSTYEFLAPKTGFWHVVVEKGTYEKPIEIKASFSVVNGVAAAHSVPRSLATSFKEADEQFDKSDDTAEEVEEVGEDDQ